MKSSRRIWADNFSFVSRTFNELEVLKFSKNHKANVEIFNAYSLNPWQSLRQEKNTKKIHIYPTGPCKVSHCHYRNS